jgi:hypothetical protein
VLWHNPSFLAISVSCDFIVEFHIFKHSHFFALFQSTQLSLLLSNMLFLNLPLLSRLISLLRLPLVLVFQMSSLLMNLGGRISVVSLFVASTYSSVPGSNTILEVVSG